MSGPAAKAKHGRILAGGIAVAAFAMLGLSYASVPLYRMFCSATGFGGTTQVAGQAPSLRGKRTLHVSFDANVAPGLRWSFAPEMSRVSLVPGETQTVFFKVVNLSDQVTTARAGYNVSPDQAGAYFDKINCFCFTEQTLAPHETAEMPVVFFLDPALEKDSDMAEIAEITLSYTFFPVKSAAPALATQTAPETNKSRL